MYVCIEMLDSSDSSNIIINGVLLFRPWWKEPQLPPLGPEDEDVARERERVKSGKAQSDILTMIDLSKVQNGTRV